MRIGPYEVVRELGRGGMGTVYLAVRDDRPRRRFAVKVINADMDSEHAIGRFDQERRILATLFHPNIARYLDGGTTEDGRPFLVMQYVDGESIDRYCDRHRLDVEARIKLFLAVCSAIQYAHQKLVIHRDVKPSNILVEEDGRVKVLDFGTAKLLDPALRLPGMTSTLTGLFLMTPSYASPEQVRGEPITTMSDVYGLGALLYELLSGHRAHRFSSSHPAEVLRVVCEVEPARPSSVVATEVVPSDASGGEPAPPQEIAELRGTQVARLQRRLAGDLDKILLQALRKEPERRYGSVEQLSADLWRHLAGMPVLARQGSLAYRGHKFVRRNRTAVAASLVALVALLAFAVGLVQQAHRTDRQRALAELERDKAEQVSAFLVDLFEGQESLGGRQGGASARELLDRGAAAIRRRAGERPEIRASLLEAVGQGYLKQGIYDRAAALLTESLEIRRSHFGRDHLDTASSLHQLGMLSLQQAEYGDADRLLREGLGIRERLAGPRGLQVADSLDGLSELYVRISDPRAEEVARRSLAIRLQHLAPDHPKVGLALSNLGGVLSRQGRYDAALPLLESALDIQRRALGADDPLVADAGFILGQTLRKSGRFERAEETLRRALAAYETAFGPRHPSVAAGHAALGALHYDWLDDASAEIEFERALELVSGIFGPDHDWTGSLHHNLGLVYLRQGDHDRAESSFERALSILERAMGRRSYNASFPIHYLGVVARRRGDLARAEALLGEAREIRRRVLPADHPDLATSFGELALLHLDRGEEEQAEELLRRTLKLRQAAFGAEHLLVASTLDDLARLCHGQGRFGEESDLLRRALAIRRRVLGEGHPVTLATGERLAAAGRRARLNHRRLAFPAGSSPPWKPAHPPRS
jgi:serine/threonine-protein kinase